MDLESCAGELGCLLDIISNVGGRPVRHDVIAVSFTEQIDIERKRLGIQKR